MFRFCSNFENFPRFIGALREVHDFGDGRSHWVGLRTPRGGRLEWDTRHHEVRHEPRHRVAEHAGLSVRTSGTLRFVPMSDGGTCVKVVLDYAVRSDSIADAVAALAVPSRARELEADIRRLPAQLDLVATADPPIALS